MQKVKNFMLKTITYTALAAAVISGYLTEADAVTRGTVLIVSLSWIALFALANRKKVK